MDLLCNTARGRLGQFFVRFALLAALAAGQSACQTAGQTADGVTDYWRESAAANDALREKRYQGAARHAENAARLALEENRGPFRRGVALMRLAFAYADLGEFEKAESAGQEALEIFESHPELDHRHGNVIEVLRLLAEIDRAEGKPCSALEKLSRARTLDSSGMVSDWEFARIYRELGRFDLAVEYVKKLDDSFITEFTWVSFHYPLAGLYWDDEQYERASDHARAALAQARSIVDGVKLIPYLQFLALILADLGNGEEPDAQLDEADALLDEAEALFEAADDSHLRSMSYVLTARAVIRMRQGRFAESDALLTEALAAMDRWPEAQTGLQRRLDQREREALRAGLIYRRAVLRETEGRHDEAVAYFEQTLKLFEKRYGRTNPRLARSLGDYRRLLAATSDEAGAARQQARLDAIAAVHRTDPLRHCADEHARGSLR